ncbi:AaceriACR082Cp [[Ashbya] aceris (nom. inval.)]|nr:AaceriACR082Cp [[Ashbya] aceris (nom. inval.)]
MSQPQSIITQVSPEQQLGGSQLMTEQIEPDYYDENTLIHLNIQGRHYYITREQLMSLPESLLLCFFPSGVFMNREGQVITNLTPEDEVYIANFPPECFESIMETYTTAQRDLENFPVGEFGRRAPQAGPKGFLGLTPSQSQPMSESEILHEKPAIIVLREDLDYYCVPSVSLTLEDGSRDGQDILLEQLMAQVKNAAGSHLCQQRSVFKGLYSSNRVRRPDAPHQPDQLGPAEQHLMDMLCASGFREHSDWGNRSQEPGKTIISSLSLCRLMNETVQEFRDQVAAARRRYDEDHVTPDAASAPPSRDHKRKSRLSTFTDNVRSRSSSRTRSSSRPPREPSLYHLVPRPEINTKLLLFWKKPARKCWWGLETITVDVQLNGHYDSESGTLVLSRNSPLCVLTIPVNLHIRRVWTLELSVVGMQ